MSKWCNIINGVPYGLSFYFLTPDTFESGEYDNLGVIGHCLKVLSLLWKPFFEPSQATYEKVAYNSEPYEEKNKPTFGKGWCYRIKDYKVSPVALGRIDAYKKKPTQGGPRNYRNESRLYNFPYTYMTIDDYINPSLTIIPHLLKEQSNVVIVIQSVGDKGTYKIYIENYKGDSEGQLEGMISSSVQDLPLSSDAYTQYMATNKNQFQTAGENLVGKAFLGVMSGINPFNLIGTAVNTAMIGANVVMQNNERNAFRADLMDAPRNMKTMGANVPFAVLNGKNQVDMTRWEMTEYEKKRIGDFFAMYGYKQNKIFVPNTRSRYHYNYIKTYQANLRGMGIPKRHLEKLKEIYNNGITLWHVDRQNVVVGDYSMDNHEYN